MLSTSEVIHFVPEVSIIRGRVDVERHANKGNDQDGRHSRRYALPERSGLRGGSVFDCPPPASNLCGSILAGALSLSDDSRSSNSEHSRLDLPAPDGKVPKLPYCRQHGNYPSIANGPIGSKACSRAWRASRALCQL